MILLTCIARASTVVSRGYWDRVTRGATARPRHGPCWRGWVGGGSASGLIVPGARVRLQGRPARAFPGDRRRSRAACQRLARLRQWPSVLRQGSAPEGRDMAASVLVVDDEHVTNDMIADLVRTRGFEPIQFFNGSGVVEGAMERRPALVLLDLMLPDLDGMEVCERLKRERQTNLIPVVMVTALNDMTHRTQGVRVGANQYLGKPFKAEQLFAAMDEALRWREQHLARGTEGEIDFDVRSEQ